MEIKILAISQSDAMNDAEKDADNLFKTGCELTKAGKLLEAVRIFTRIIDNKHQLAEAFFRRGVCHYLRGDFRSAEADMNAATLFGCVTSQIWSRYDTHRVISPRT